MIAFTVFDPVSRRVTSHKFASDAQSVLAMIFAGEAALVGRHVPFDEAVPDGSEFVVENPDAAEKWAPPISDQPLIEWP